MKITRPQLRQIIFEEHELAVEKQRLRNIINEEYLNVLQEAQNDEAFYKLIRKATAGTVVNLSFTKTVTTEVDLFLTTKTVTAFKKGKSYKAEVLKSGEVSIRNETPIDPKEMSKEDLIVDVKKAGGPSGVLDFNKTIIKYPKQTPATLTSLIQGPKKAVAKAPVEKPEVKKTADQVSKNKSLEDSLIDVDFGADVPKGYYRWRRLIQALPYNHPAWKERGATWWPDLSEGQPGPPGFLGHATDDEQKQLHFHHPEWPIWKEEEGRKFPPNRIIRPDGSIGKYPPGAPAKPPEAEKKTEPALAGAEGVTGTPGEQIDIPEEKVPGKDWYRAAGRDIAFHVSDERWATDGYSWTPRAGEAGPPGWFGHRETHGTLQEQIPAPVDPNFEDPESLRSSPTRAPEKKEKGVLHFHHPNWPGWKKMKHDHIIDSGGRATAMAKSEKKPGAKPKKDATGLDFVQLFQGFRKWISKNLNEIPDWNKLLNAIEIKPEQLQYLKKMHQEMGARDGDGKAPVATALGVLQKEFNKARSAGTKYEPNFEALKTRFNLSDDQLETVRSAYTELVTAPGQFDPAEKKPEAVPGAEKEKPTSVKVDPDSEWIGKSMREVVKLTKAGLKKVLKRSTRANNYDGDGWFRGGLLKLRRKHPLRRKYAKWYKDYRAKKRAERRAKRRS